MAGMKAFLKNLGTLYSAFDVHLKADVEEATLYTAINKVNQVHVYLEQVISKITKNVQQIAENVKTNGPQGTVSENTRKHQKVFLKRVTRTLFLTSECRV